LALAACGGAQPALAGTQWNLAALNGQAPVAGFDRLALKFESDSQVSGNSGCNSFGGSYTATGGALRFGPLAGTLRACAEQALNDQEARYYTALSNTAAFELAGGRLLFKDASGATVLVFDPA
jgi:putative lipoprotein